MIAVEYPHRRIVTWGKEIEQEKENRPPTMTSAPIIYFEHRPPKKAQADQSSIYDIWARVQADQESHIRFN